SHVESDFVESLSNHDHLEEIFEPLMPIHIAEEKKIRREHAKYNNRIEMMFTINPRPTINANTIFESIPSSLIPIQDNDSQREEIDIVTETDDVLPLGVENDDDLKGEIDDVAKLHRVRTPSLTPVSPFRTSGIELSLQLGNQKQAMLRGSHPMPIHFYFSFHVLHAN
nr:hypothetical protein [Tanacetum cinerariifolium]